jgi:hypothetical protein
MSIQNYINELQSINIAIAKNNKENASLRKRAKSIEEEITKYLEVKEQPGVKFKDVAVVVETKPKWAYKGKKDKEEDSIKILREYGVSDPRGALDDLFRVRKGEEMETKKIRIKKIKKPKE